MHAKQRDRNRNSNRLPSGGVGVRGESCKDCSIMHADIVRVIGTGQVQALPCLADTPTKLYPVEQELVGVFLHDVTERSTSGRQLIPAVADSCRFGRHRPTGDMNTSLVSTTRHEH